MGEGEGIDYVFGFGGGNAVLGPLIAEVGEAVRAKHAVNRKRKVRSFKNLHYGARGWGCERALVARLEASEKGLDIRYIVTSLKGSAKDLYETVYCAATRRRISSSSTRCSSPPIARPAGILAPIGRA
jgi:hypothetical protein